MSKQETAAQLRKVANFMKGLIQAADDIEAIGSMEGAGTTPGGSRPCGDMAGPATCTAVLRARRPARTE